MNARMHMLSTVSAVSKIANGNHDNLPEVKKYKATEL